MTEAVDSYQERAIRSGVTEITDRALVIVRNDPALPGLKKVLGTALPTRHNRFVEAQDRTIAWVGPDEWMIIGTSGEQGHLCSKLDLALEDVHHAVVDVSGGRTIIRLSGSRARGLLSAAASLDFHPRAFSPGQCAQTNLTRTDALILMRDEKPTFDLVVRRSYALYVRNWLCSAATSRSTPMAVC